MYVRELIYIKFAQKINNLYKIKINVTYITKIYTTKNTTHCKVPKSTFVSTCYIKESSLISSIIYVLLEYMYIILCK